MNSYHFSQSWQNALDRTFSFLPEILGFILLLIVGWIFAAIVRNLVVKLLRRLRFERAVTLSPAGNYVTRMVEHPTEFVGKVAYWLIFLAFLSFAFSSLHVPAITYIVNGIYSYIPNVIAAVLIFLVASAITAGAEAFVNRVLKFSPLAKVIGAIIPALTMSIAIFMILSQLKIAPSIVNITYTALMGAIALGLALAFGLGGRDVAARILTQAYESTLQNSGRIKGDLKQAAENTRSEAQRVRNAAKNKVEEDE